MEPNKNCKFNGDALAFLYDELPSAERLQFEDHLTRCHLCTDEFAAIADARLAVYEWNSLEFAHLETPEFHLPIPESDAVKVGFIQSIKAFFSPSFNWATATTGFAGLIVIGVIGLMLFNMSGPDQITSSITADQPSIEEVFKVIENDGNESSASVTNDIDTSDKPLREVNEFEYINAAENNLRNVKRPVRNQPRPTVQRISVGMDNMPTRLSNFEETPDDSLRLSELFDDSGIS